jgi:aminoglycoside/choline kinase family phosphotransferase
MRLTTENLSPSVQVWLERWLSDQGITNKVRVEALAGDGSQRTFYRLFLNNKSLVLLSDPDWISSKDYPAHQVYLASIGARVPRFLAADPEAGCLVMEDLGDEYLQTRLLAEPKLKMSWLKKAVKTLVDFQGKAYPVPRNLPVSQRRFDAVKLRDELFFTLEHLSKKFLGNAAPSPEALESLTKFCGGLDSIRPQVFCHRDYHSRNLMVHAEELFLIDFQDARLGPPQYDLASLIYDAYVPLSPSERTELSQLYLEEIKCTPVGQELDENAFASQLERVAFQRVVKAAGSFASFFTRFGKSTHLPYLLPALAEALELQSKNAEIRELKSVFPIQKWIQQVSHSVRISP